MIARLWRGWVRSERLEEYAEIVERTGMAGYRRTPGNAGAQLLTRDVGEGRAELVTLSWWPDMEHIRAFAGDDPETARYYPEDDEYLLDRETTVAHYEVAHFEVAPPQQRPGAATAAAADSGSDSDTGFALSRVFEAEPARVFAHFVEPEAFSRWFVVDGFDTPADRVDLDPREGGAVSGVMVPSQGGEEIPFTAAYGAVDPPRTAQYVFTDPAEVVTLSLLDLGDEGTQLTYRNEGAPPTDRAGALSRVGTMLDAIESSLRGAR